MRPPSQASRSSYTRRTAPLNPGPVHPIPLPLQTLLPLSKENTNSPVKSPKNTLYFSLSLCSSSTTSSLFPVKLAALTTWATPSSKREGNHRIVVVGASSSRSLLDKQAGQDTDGATLRGRRTYTLPSPPWVPSVAGESLGADGPSITSAIANNLTPWPSDEQAKDDDIEALRSRPRNQFSTKHTLHKYLHLPSLYIYTYIYIHIYITPPTPSPTPRLTTLSPPSLPSFLSPTHSATKQRPTCPRSPSSSSSPCAT